MNSNKQPPPLFGYRKFWAQRFGVAPFLPMSRPEMEALGWDSCDIILVTGDAYVDHPSFGMALIGRLLEAQGFRVGIICQPDWNSAADFRRLGKPNLFFGVTAGNMDSMVNRYTADRKIRSDDAYTPNAEADKRPDRAVTVYAQRCREAFPGAAVVIGSIEASLRRIAHYDYWSDKVRRSVLADSKADLLVFGNAERAVVELAHRLARGEKIGDIRDLRGTAFMAPRGWLPAGDWDEVDSTEVDTPGAVLRQVDPYGAGEGASCAATGDGGGAVLAPLPPRGGGAGGEGEVEAGLKPVQIQRHERVGFKPAPTEDDPPPPLPNPSPARGEGLEGRGARGPSAAAASRHPRSRTVIRLPAYEAVHDDPVLYAHASRTLHLESNPGNARALRQGHGERDVWLNPPPLPLSSEELDRIYELPYARRPHPGYGEAKIPAWEMIRFSVNIMRGCFGGCTFCSITEHEGRIIQSRSEDSVIREIEDMRDKTPGFTGIVSDLGGPTANMFHLKCKDEKIEAACRRLSCVWPDICVNMGTDHAPLISLYRRARALKGVKKVLIGSGLRYDLAVRSPEYIRELVTHHVGGYLKIAPEHTEEGVLAKMMKPGIAAYDRFKQLFDRFSREAGKEQYLIPYFIAAHPGSSDEDMLKLAQWLKKNNFRLDQVQTFLPTPMALATTMYHTEQNPLKKLRRQGGEVVGAVRGGRQRKLHKAFLRYHDAENWPLLREALKAMGRADLIGNGKKHLVPAWQPAGTGQAAKPAASVPARNDSRPGRFAAPARREAKTCAPAGKPAKRRPK